MKRVLSGIAVCSFLFSFAACGDDDDADERTAYAEGEEQMVIGSTRAGLLYDGADADDQVYDLSNDQMTCVKEEVMEIAPERIPFSYPFQEAFREDMRKAYEACDIDLE